MKIEAFFVYVLIFVGEVYAVTKISFANHSDPFYTDRCFEMTREICDYCCLVDFEFCSRDIGICQPVIDRNLGLLLDAVLMLGGITMGFPILIHIMGFLISYRCCKRYFPETGGASCY